MTQFEINRQARAIGHFEIDIAADRRTVWTTLANLERWPEWNRSVRHIAMNGPVRVGTVFRWNADGIPIRSCLEVVDENEELAWTGRSPGIRARHIWRFSDLRGATRVTTEESFDGLLPLLFPARMTEALDVALRQGASALRDACELT